jgi:hypothetical protein
LGAGSPFANLASFLEVLNFSTKVPPPLQSCRLFSIFQFPFPFFPSFTFGFIKIGSIDKKEKMRIPKEKSKIENVAARLD